MPASAGAATADDTPGTTSNGMPARASASASSPPRPNTYGSPHLSRTTVQAAARVLDQQAVQHVLRRSTAGRRACRRRTSARAAPARAALPRRARRRAPGRPRASRRAPRTRDQIGAARSGADDDDAGPTRSLTASTLPFFARRRRADSERVQQQRPPLGHRHAAGAPGRARSALRRRRPGLEILGQHRLEPLAQQARQRRARGRRSTRRRSRRPAAESPRRTRSRPMDRRPRARTGAGTPQPPPPRG